MKRQGGRKERKKSEKNVCKRNGKRQNPNIKSKVKDVGRKTTIEHTTEKKQTGTSWQ